MKKEILLLFFLIPLNQVKSQDFILTQNSLFPASYSSSDVGDYDNDGDIDIIISGGTTGWDDCEKYTKIFDNDGHGQFTENKKNTFIGLINSSIAWGDFNKDGLLDFIISGNDKYPFGTANAGYQKCITKIYRNIGNGYFEEVITQIVGLNRGHVSWADLNKDGYLDVLINGSTDIYARPTTKIYRNNKNSTFTEVFTTITGTDLGDSRCIDINNDGLLDILISGHYKDSLINDISWKGVGITILYKNEGNFSFTPITYQFSPMDGRSQICDFNKDGYKDILMADWFGTSLYIYINDTKGSFIRTTPNIGIRSVNNELNVGDFNNDGYNDIFISGPIPDTWNFDAKLYLNNGNMTFRESEFNFNGVFVGTSNYADFNNDGKIDLFYTGGTTGYGDNPIAYLYMNNINNTGLSNIKNSDIIIYPNPTKNKIYIKSDVRPFEISIYKSDGKIVLQKRLNNENEVNVSTLNGGIYFIKISTENGIYKRVLVKE